MCDCLDYLPAFYRKDTPVARKSHVCSECGGAIKVGQKYEIVVGKWGGEFCRFKTCATCMSVMSRMMDEGVYCVCYGTIFEELGEWIGETGNDWPELAIADADKRRMDRLADARQ